MHALNNCLVCLGAYLMIVVKSSSLPYDSFFALASASMYSVVTNALAYYSGPTDLKCKS
jgi:hypothetical protein